MLIKGKKWFYQLDLTLSGSDCKVHQMVQCCGPGSEVTSYNIITLYRHWCKRLLFHFNPVPANVCARAVENGPKIWSPATAFEDLSRVPGSWICLGPLPAPDIVTICVIKQLVEDPSFSLSLTLLVHIFLSYSVFQLNKIRPRERKDGCFTVTHAILLCTLKPSLSHFQYSTKQMLLK